MSPRARATALLATCLWSLLAAGCSVAPSQPVRPYAGAPASHQLEGLPFHPQIEDQCGPASLATLLGYWGIEQDPEALRGKLYIPGKGGTVTTEMAARARRYGLLAFEPPASLDAILTEVAAGNPVLVLRNLAYPWQPMWHYSIVTGYNSDTQEVILRSGNELAQVLPASLFLRTWERADHWALVILPPDRLPATASEQQFLAAARELETVGEVAAARTAYDTALTRWPDSRTAHFGAGNTAYQAGDYTAAATHFEQLVTGNPRDGDAWNNLGFALDRQGCREQARAAVECAVAIDPDNSEYRHSLGELSGGVSTAVCELPACVSASE